MEDKHDAEQPGEELLSSGGNSRKDDLHWKVSGHFFLLFILSLLSLSPFFFYFSASDSQCFCADMFQCCTNFCVLLRQRKASTGMARMSYGGSCDDNNDDDDGGGLIIIKRQP